MTNKVLRVIGVLILLALFCWAVTMLLSAYVPHIVVTILIVVAVAIAILFLGRLFGLWD